MDHEENRLFEKEKSAGFAALSLMID